MRTSPNCILVALTEPMYTPVSPKTFPTAVVSTDFDDKQIKKHYEVQHYGFLELVTYQWDHQWQFRFRDTRAGI